MGRGAFRGCAAVIVFLMTVLSTASAPPGEAGGPTPRPTARPYVTFIDPADGAMGVPLYSWIFVQFNDRMNASNTIIHIEPLVTLTPHWLSFNTSVLFRHQTEFAPCTTHWLYVDGTNLAGESLLLWDETPGPANPWTFTTECPAFTITRTIPFNGQTNVAVAAGPLVGPNLVIWFSRPADPTSLQVTLSPPVPLSPVWSNGNAKVTMDHATSFQECTEHTVTVSAKDAQGVPLSNVTGSKANPWTFTTTCLTPRILRTEPADGAVGVELDAPIVVTFSVFMNASTLNWSISPQPGFFFDWTWYDYDKVLMLTHTVPFPKLTTYTVNISGQTPQGADLLPGPVPNPWSFTTTAVPAPKGLHVARSSPDITLTWNPSPGAQSYGVYSSSDKFAPWPWSQVGEVPTIWFVDPGADADGTDHYYVVRAKDSAGVEGGNSTMGFREVIPFPFDRARTNIHWISMPYRSKYHAAEDISDELTSANIDVVGKWEPATQRTLLYYYFRGQWKGTNFPVNPGDGIYISVRASFQWKINGTDGPVPHPFAWYPPPHPNIHWISLPFTSTYRRASEVVLDIEGSLAGNANTKIGEVAKWDAGTQTLMVFRWTLAGWTGSDFPIAAGEGIYLRVASPFAWMPDLITPESP